MQNEERIYWLELLVESGVVSAEKLALLRRECEELAAIFVTIETSKCFLILNFYFLILNSSLIFLPLRGRFSASVIGP